MSNHRGDSDRGNAWITLAAFTAAVWTMIVTAAFGVDVPPWLYWATITLMIATLVYLLLDI
jgi:hypothetical protein